MTSMYIVHNTTGDTIFPLSCCSKSDAQLAAETSDDTTCKYCTEINDKEVLLKHRVPMRLRG